MIYFIVLLYVSVCFAKIPVFQDWDALLKINVHLNKTVTGSDIRLNVVNYTAINADPKWKSTLKELSDTVAENFSSRNQFLAYYINAYNILAVKTIIDNPCQKDLFGGCRPLRGIRDVGTIISAVWNKPAGSVNGTVVTLQQIEDTLRQPSTHGFPNYKEDARIHAAIVCASISCPNLQPWAYTEQLVDQQLTQAMSEFLANPKKGLAVDCAQKTMTVSAIFSFYPHDFIASPYGNGSVQQFIDNPTFGAQHRLKCLARPLPALQYFNYDWNLNGDPLPCAQERPCYTIVALGITVTASFCAMFLCCCVCCIARRRRASKFIAV